MSSSSELYEDEDGLKDEKNGKRSNTLSVLVAVIITAIVVAAVCVSTTYYLHPDYVNPNDPPMPIHDCPTEEPKSSTEHSLVTPRPTEPPNPENNRFDCGPDRDGIDQATCESRGCTWSPATTSGPPSCFYPEGYGTYDMNTFFTEPWGYRAELQRRVSTPNHFSEGIDTLWLDVELQTKSRLHFKIYDPNEQRFEVPNDLPGTPASAAETRLYSVAFNGRPFSFQVTRIDTGNVVRVYCVDDYAERTEDTTRDLAKSSLVNGVTKQCEFRFDTSVGALVFEDQFLQLSTKLSSHNVYGFGEHEHESFRHDMNWKRWGSFSRDQPPSPEANLYGTHPFYMCLEDDSNAHGVFLNNANGQDVALQPTPALTFRHIGGVLDFYMFFGPTPEDVVAQYTETIGRPVMPPYWALGFQLSRYGYNGIDNVKAVVARMRQYNIPHDVLYGDIDYMERQLDFTIDEEIYGEENLAQFVRDIKEEGTNYIIILDPAISANETAGTYRAYDAGVVDDVFIHDDDGGIFYGKVWPDYPGVEVDPSQPWEYQTEDMNEPANFVQGSVTGCSNNKWDYPPYHPKIWGAVMADKTLCMNAKQNLDENSETIHYNMHSLYGWSQSEPTLSSARAATGKRSLVITRSTYAGSGKYSGHWLGDNASIWPHMHKSIIGMLEFNLFGVPFDQDPAAFGEAFAVEMRDLFAIRYTLLPYLYTLHYKATAHGHTVIRPLMHEFTSDSNTWSIDRQFLWGPAFMITPVLEEDAVTVSAYIPESRWYDWYTGKEVDPSLVGTYVTLDAPTSYIPLHIRGGHILPIQQPANSTKFSRSNPFGLIVALSEGYSAIGTLFWDDGESIDTISNGWYYEIEYLVAQGNLVASIMNSYGTLFDNQHLDTISVHGMASRPPWVKLNGVELMDSQWNYSDFDKVRRTIGTLLVIPSNVNRLQTSQCFRLFLGDE
ncbi:Sucrase-isomaltase, intestinal [Holothuria leucospilota]|uniref:Maltase n=1 Tax=Holothuria leucospilota TaxID=206669 RepID=A0A9Q1BN06_HOLLE|nr:Sucrase-isomaltase, intestinal [Holothuria leucospilota]